MINQYFKTDISRKNFKKLINEFSGIDDLAMEIKKDKGDMIAGFQKKSGRFLGYNLLAILSEKKESLLFVSAYESSKKIFQIYEYGTYILAVVLLLLAKIDKISSKSDYLNYLLIVLILLPAIIRYSIRKYYDTKYTKVILQYIKDNVEELQRIDYKEYMKLLKNSDK